MEQLQYRFVEFMPPVLENDILYISMEYCTAIHLCVCGCNNKVVTPLSPTGWKMIFDGRSISLTPSIGNWNFDCQSHYFITKNKIEWSGKWSREKIEHGRMHSKDLKEEFFKEKVVEKAIDVPVKEFNNSVNGFGLNSIARFFKRIFNKEKGGIKNE